MEDDLEITEINCDSLTDQNPVHNDPVVFIPSSDSEDERHKDESYATPSKQRCLDSSKNEFLSEMEQKLVNTVCDLSSNISKMTQIQSEMVDALRDISSKIGSLISTINTYTTAVPNPRMEVDSTQQKNFLETPKDNEDESVAGNDLNLNRIYGVINKDNSAKKLPNKNLFSVKKAANNNNNNNVKLVAELCSNRKRKGK